MQDKNSTIDCGDDLDKTLYLNEHQEELHDFMIITLTKHFVVIQIRNNFMLLW